MSLQMTWLIPKISRITVEYSRGSRDKRLILIVASAGCTARFVVGALFGALWHKPKKSTASVIFTTFEKLTPNE